MEEAILRGWSATLSATWKAAEDDCLERRNSIRPRVPSRVAYRYLAVSAPLLRAWVHCPRAPERFVASPLCLDHLAGNGADFLLVLSSRTLEEPMHEASK